MNVLGVFTNVMIISDSVTDLKTVFVIRHFIALEDKKNFTHYLQLFKVIAFCSCVNLRRNLNVLSNGKEKKENSLEI